jgi:hypothetical protein
MSVFFGRGENVLYDRGNANIGTGSFFWTYRPLAAGEPGGGDGGAAGRRPAAGAQEPAG